MANHTALIAKNGTEVQLADSGSPIRDSNGNITGVVLVFRDVTEEYRMNEALAESQQRLDFAVKGTNAGLWDWNVQTGELALNNRWAEIIGHNLQELEPVDINTWARLAHPDDLQISNEKLSKHFSQNTDIYDTGKVQT